MKNAIKSEFRKLFTVRSTYVIIVINLLLVIFFAGYIEGFRAVPESLQKNSLLASESQSAVLITGMLLAISGLLLVGHEYRYNTIMYTLTAPNRRLKPFFAKIIAASVLAILFGAFVTFFSPLCTILGTRLHGLDIASQNFPVWSLLWRCVFCVWGYMMFAFVLISIIRSQIGAIVTFLLIPLMGENVLIALLHENAKYLPFTSLQAVTGAGALAGTTPEQSALTALLYIVVGIIVGAILFVRRDAN